MRFHHCLRASQFVCKCKLRPWWLRETARSLKIHENSTKLISAVHCCALQVTAVNRTQHLNVWLGCDPRDRPSNWATPFNPPCVALKKGPRSACAQPQSADRWARPRPTHLDARPDVWPLRWVGNGGLLKHELTHQTHHLASSRIVWTCIMLYPGSNVKRWPR